MEPLLRFHHKQLNHLLSLKSFPNLPKRFFHCRERRCTKSYPNMLTLVKWFEKQEQKPVIDALLKNKWSPTFKQIVWVSCQALEVVRMTIIAVIIITVCLSPSSQQSLTTFLAAWSVIWCFCHNEALSIVFSSLEQKWVKVSWLNISGLTNSKRSYTLTWQNLIAWQH